MFFKDKVVTYDPKKYEKDLTPEQRVLELKNNDPIKGINSDSGMDIGKNQDFIDVMNNKINDYLDKLAENKEIKESKEFLIWVDLLRKTKKSTRIYTVGILILIILYNPILIIPIGFILLIFASTSGKNNNTK